MLRMDVTGVQNGESQKNGRQQENAVASRIEEETELDATHGNGRRPELKRLEEWTPESDGHGVQNRGWDGIGRYVWK